MRNVLRRTQADASELIPAIGMPLELTSRFSLCRSARKSDAC